MPKMHIDCRTHFHILFDCFLLRLLDQFSAVTRYTYIDIGLRFAYTQDASPIEMTFKFPMSLPIPLFLCAQFIKSCCCHVCFLSPLLPLAYWRKAEQYKNKHTHSK